MITHPCTADAGTRRARLSLVLATIFVPMAITALLAPSSPGQNMSFGARRKAFEAAFEAKDLKKRIQAVKDFSEHGHPETVRYLLELTKRVNHQLTKARNEWAGAVVARAKASREVSRIQSLVKTGKLGKRKLERAKAVLKEATALATRYDGTVKQDAGIAQTLRKSVGWVVQRCSDLHKNNCRRIITSAYKGSRTVEDRADLLRIMVWVDLPELMAMVDNEASHRDGPTRVAALRAIEERGGKRALRPALRCLQDPVWQVRAQAIRILRKVGGKEAAGALAEAMAKEDGRLVTDAMSALKALTGQNFHDNVYLWREWLAKNGDQLPQPTETKNAPPPPKPKVAKGAGKGGRKKAAGHGTGFYGINTKSKHIVYVIDFSGSMSAPLAGTRGGGPRPAPGPARIGGKRKVDGVATELLKSIESLPKDGTFNVVLFNTGVVTWQKKMMPAIRVNKDAIHKWVLGRGPGGATNLFEGLERGFGFAGRGSFDKHYKSAVDTIFLLSDGSPTAGRVRATGAILREIGAINDLRRIAVHTVGLGRQLNVAFLRRLARENDGDFVHVTR